MYCIAWKYTVSSNQSKFEEEYSRNGSWFKFFEPCEDYLGHELMKAADGQTYLLLDKWMSKEDYDDFLQNNQLAYEQLNEKCKSLYDNEESMGSYTILQ